MSDIKDEPSASDANDAYDPAAAPVGIAPSIPPSSPPAAEEPGVTVDALAKRVAALGEEDENERLARLEEEKLAERRALARKGKKKGSLEGAASKKLDEIGSKSVRRKTRDVQADLEEEELDVARARSAEDPLIERTRRISEWVQKNRHVVGYGAAAAVLALLGSFAYAHFQHKTEADASTLLGKAVGDEFGIIGEQKEEEEDGPQDPRPHFKDMATRRETALGKYREVETKFRGTGAATVARLAEAGLLLDTNKPDEAITAFDEVRASALAKADSEVRGRALEGKGFAQELKHMTKEALTTFKELENEVDIRGFKELAMYHQARAQETLGEKEKAKELLMTVRERISKPGDSHPFGYLRSMVDDRIRAIDPKAIPEPAPMGGMGGMGGPGGGKMSPAQMQEMIRRMQEKMGKGSNGAP
jgi:hypothetical protein